MRTRTSTPPLPLAVDTISALDVSLYLLTQCTTVSEVRNALDKDPPLTPNTTLPIPPYNGQLYDVLGRSYRIGFGYRF